MAAAGAAHAGHARTAAMQAKPTRYSMVAKAKPMPQLNAMVLST